MASLPRNRDRVRCLIRREWVAATPEECIRQRLLKLMLEQLEYPSGLVSVETFLKELGRRADILCYSQSTLKPILLIECKAVPINEKARRQLVGYNQHVGAPYICLANDEYMLTGWWDVTQGDYQFAPGLPRYVDL